MSWQEVSTLSLKQEFVTFAQLEDCNFTMLCKSFNISRKTGYKLLHRFIENGAVGLLDVSRRPKNSPLKTKESTEAAIVALRKAHPAWGGRKLKKVRDTRASGCSSCFDNHEHIAS